MKQQHFIINFLVSLVGWIVSPLVFLSWNFGAMLPEAVMIGFSKRFGTFLRGRTRRMTLHNMQTVLQNPAWTQEQWNALWQSHAEHIGRTLYEIIQIDSMPMDKLRKQIIIEGEQHLRQALAGGHGAMLFFNHLGNLVITVSGTALTGHDITVAGNPVWIPYLERKVRHIHQRLNINRALIGDNFPKTAADIFRRNGIFGIFIDFSVTEKHTTWMQFGQAELAVNLGPAIMALRHETPVICVSSIRTSNNSHRVIFHPPITQVTGADIHQKATNLLRQALQFLETDLAAHPEQWWPWNYAPLRQHPETSNVLSDKPKSGHDGQQ